MSAREHFESTPDDRAAMLRVPPHSTLAEQSILGGLLLDNGAFDRVADVITEADFYRHDHRLIWAAISRLVMANKPADVITVHEVLGAKAEEVGGLQYLNALAQGVPSAANVRRYGEVVREKSLLRQVIALADNTAAQAWREDVKAGEVLDAAAAKISALERGTMTSAPVIVGDLVAKQLDRYNDLAAGNIAPGIPTGLDVLDVRLNGGLRPAFYVLAARPSVGKSALAEQIALALADRDIPSLFLSMEMTKEEVTDRAIANLAGVSLAKLQTGKMTDDEWARVAVAADRLKAMPFHIDDQPALRLADIRAKARAVKRLGLLVIDYLQLCSGDGDTRNAQLEGVSRGLKELQKELRCPVIALAQLNRKVEERATKRPTMADIRDCGAIEQDADVIAFLWPFAENKDTGTKIHGVALDKNRTGTCGEACLEFYGPHQRFSDSDRKPVKKIGDVGGGFE